METALSGWKELKNLPAGGVAPIDLIYLMAAAVPVGHLASRGRLEASKNIARRRIAFHSNKDKTLQVWFRLGEPLAWVIRAESGLHFKAAGIDGEPASFWSSTENSRPNDHGDYWTDPRIARKLALELGAAPRNLLTARPPTARTATHPRNTPEHAIGRRRLGRKR